MILTQKIVFFGMVVIGIDLRKRSNFVDEFEYKVKKHVFKWDT